jgi:hypothetical protein
VRSRPEPHARSAANSASPARWIPIALAQRAHRTSVSATRDLLPPSCRPTRQAEAPVPWPDWRRSGSVSVAQTPSVDCIGAGSVQERRSGWHAVGSGPDVSNSRRRRPGWQRAGPAACARRRGASRGRTDLSSSLPRREPGECLAVLTMIRQIGRAWGGPAPSRPGLAQNRNSAAIGRVDGSSASGSANASTSASWRSAVCTTASRRLSASPKSRPRNSVATRRSTRAC